MKNTIFCALMLFITTGIIAQININPDPNGEPWLVGGVPEITPEMQAEIDSISNFKLNPSCLLLNLPASVDNSKNPFMRGIFRQNGNSCAQASTVGYMFTYEINYERNIPSNHDSVLYHPSFTYNFLNYGRADSGSRIDDGLRILKEMGCPSIQIYNTSIEQADSTEWITGYEKYYSAIQNRIVDDETIDMVSDSGLFFMKHWLANHNSQDTVGGLAVFAVKHMDSVNYQMIQEGPETGKSIIVSSTYTCKSDAHVLTIVGYNDSIRYDLNNTGTYEENELGAFKVANSWGKSWKRPIDSGYCYILYSLFSDDSIFLNGKDAYICHASFNYEPEITIKAKMTHPNRKYFTNQLGSDTITGNSSPKFTNFLCR